MSTIHSITLLKVNQLTSIQDLGRISAQHLGFSASGAADERAFLSANQLLENNNNDACIEVVLGGLSFQVNCDCTIAITGADCQAKINGENIANWQIFQLKSNDIVTLSAPKQGVYSYIAFVGGIQTPLKINSRSALASFESTLLSKQTTLPLSTCPTKALPCLTKSQSNSAMCYFTDSSLPLTLRFIPYRCWSTLSKHQQQILTSTYHLSNTSNKMGYRLSGPAVELTGIKPLSKPVCYGAIQIPNDGQPIILMKDRQTIGGYPTLGAIIQTDLFRLAQQRPNQAIKFIPTSLAKAQQQLSCFIKNSMSKNKAGIGK